jgi:hypothetical protein
MPPTLAGAAAGGGLVLSDIGGQPIMDAIRKVRARLDTERQALAMINREPWLSNTPIGKFVAEHAQKVAAGDPESLHEVLTKVEAVLDDLESGISTAMAAYHASDGASKQAFKGVGGE